jgi:hypothetical protein
MRARQYAHVNVEEARRVRLIAFVKVLIDVHRPLWRRVDPEDFK